MSGRHSWIAIPCGLVILAIAVGAAIYVVGRKSQGISRAVARRNATTAPTTLPTSAPSLRPPPGTYIEVVRASNPDVATTQPLAIPVNLSEAAHVRLRDPVYVSAPPRADLWVTRAEAEPVAAVIKSIGDEQTHVVQER